MTEDGSIYFDVIADVVGRLEAAPFFADHDIPILHKSPGNVGYLTESALAQAGGIAVEVEVKHVKNLRPSQHYNVDIWVYEVPTINRERTGYATAMQTAVVAGKVLDGQDWLWTDIDHELINDGSTLLATAKVESIVQKG